MKILKRIFRIKPKSYWEKRCRAAERYMDLTIPNFEDLTQAGLDAFSMWHSIKYQYHQAEHPTREQLLKQIETLTKELKECGERLMPEQKDGL